MALRLIREEGDDILNRQSREVTEVNDKIKLLIGDMKETMIDAGGVGLAAVQVGVLRRIVVIDVDGTREEEDESGNKKRKKRNPEEAKQDSSELLVMINPKIVDKSGEQTGDEGCLSFPGKAGKVTRPDHVVVKALDMDMNEITVEGEGLLARALCHEIDHLDGHIYTEKVEGEIFEVKAEEEEE